MHLHLMSIILPDHASCMHRNSDPIRSDDGGSESMRNISRRATVRLPESAFLSVRLSVAQLPFLQHHAVLSSLPVQDSAAGSSYMHQFQVGHGYHTSFVQVSL